MNEFHLSYELEDNPFEILYLDDYNVELTRPLANLYLSAANPEVPMARIHQDILWRIGEPEDKLSLPNTNLKIKYWLNIQPYRYYPENITPPSNWTEEVLSEVVFGVKRRSLGIGGFKFDGSLTKNSRLYEQVYGHVRRAVDEKRVNWKAFESQTPKENVGKIVDRWGQIIADYSPK